jgi:hypothetical protein
MSKTQAQVFENAKARVSIERLTDNVVLLTMRGSVSRDLAVAVGQALNDELARGGQTLTFWDLERLKDYDSRLRIDCTRALQTNWAKVKSVTVLALSPIVRMGVAVANLALDNRIDAHSTRAAWQKRLDAALDKHRSESAANPNVLRGA